MSLCDGARPKLFKIENNKYCCILTDPVPPEGDPSEDAPVSREKLRSYLQLVDVLHIHVIQIDFGVFVRIGVQQIGIHEWLVKYDWEKQTVLEIIAGKQAVKEKKSVQAP